MNTGGLCRGDGEPRPVELLNSPLSPDASASARPPKKRRWRRRLIAGGLVLLALYLFREPLLRTLAEVVVAEDPLTPADGLVVLDGDHVREQAAQLYHADYARHVLLIERRPRRLERLGILPSDLELARHRLHSLEVPDEALAVLPGRALNDWDALRLLGDWLSHHPGERIILLCDRFSSRRLSHILRRVLAGEAGRVYLHPLPSRRYDQTNWWRTREGVNALVTAYLGLGYVWVYGEESEEARCEFDLDAYETNLR